MIHILANPAPSMVALDLPAFSATRFNFHFSRHYAFMSMQGCVYLARKPLFFFKADERCQEKIWMRGTQKIGI
jgi:hypothetical protein